MFERIWLEGLTEIRNVEVNDQNYFDDHFGWVFILLRFPGHSAKDNSSTLAHPLLHHDLSRLCYSQRYDTISLTLLLFYLFYNVT